MGDDQNPAMPGSAKSRDDVVAEPRLFRRNDSYLSAQGFQTRDQYCLDFGCAFRIARTRIDVYERGEEIHCVRSGGFRGWLQPWIRRRCDQRERPQEQKHKSHLVSIDLVGLFLKKYQWHSCSAANLAASGFVAVHVRTMNAWFEYSMLPVCCLRA